MNEISEITRRNIVDELVLLNMDPSGRLQENEFFSRIFDLKKLPSQDYRFRDMAGDLWQHRVNNYDWNDAWWVSDSRLSILTGPDEIFLQFLAEMVHPIVRPDASECQTFLDLFNKHLVAEGWEIAEVSRVGPHPIYGGRRRETIAATAVADAKDLAQTLGTYAARQVTRMELALLSDPDLAIGTAKEFIETICRTILAERQISPPKDDDLPALVKLTVKSLPIVPDGVEDQRRIEGTITRLLNNLMSIGHSIAELRNAFGTGHGKEAEYKGLNVHHAKLVVHLVSTVGVFLYEVHERNGRETP